MLKIIGWFWFASGIIGMIVSIIALIAFIINRDDAVIVPIPFLILSILIIFYCHKTHFGYKVPYKKIKELKRIEFENMLLQKKIELKKLTAQKP